MKSSGELLKSFCCSLMRRQGSHCQADLGFSKHNLAKRIRKLLSCCTMRLWKSCKTKRHRKRCVFLTCLRMTEKLIAAWTDLFLKCMSVIFSRQSLYSMSHWIGLFVQWILYNKTLNVWALRKLVGFVFPQVLMFPSTLSRETSGHARKQN